MDQFGNVLVGVNVSNKTYAIDIPVVTNANFDFLVRNDASSASTQVKLDGGTPSELTRQALHDLEPSFPWDASLLAMRADCYEATEDPRAALARREQQRLARNEARRFQYATRSERPLLGVLPVRARERPGTR